MIINKLEIHNFKNYCDESIPLNIVDGKNIVIIGGYNGAGKTTLTEAIRLCLYGHSMSGQPLSDNKYQSYLKSVHNKDNKNKKIEIKMEIELTDSDPHKVYEISRSFEKKNGQYVESIELKKDNEPVELIGENYWNYYVEKLIPPATSRYFFFDGENIRNIIASDGAREYLTEAMNDLSGISDLNTLNEDLEGLRKKIHSKTSSKTSQQKIDSLNTVINELLQKNKEMERKKEILHESINLIEEDNKMREKTLKHYIGINTKKYNDWKNEITSIESQIHSLNQQIADYAHNKLPFVIAKNNLKHTVERAKKENNVSIYSHIVEYINSYGKKSLEGVVDPLNIDNIIDKLVSDAEQKSDYSEEIVLDLSLQQIRKIESIKIDDSSVNDFINNCKRKDELCTELSKVKEKLTTGEDESISSINSAIEENKEKINAKKNEMAALESTMSYNNSLIKEKKKQIHDEEKLSLLSDLDKEMVKNIGIISDEIEQRIKTIKEKALLIFKEKTNEMYSKLKNKKSMVKEISFSESMDIELNGYDGDLVDVASISEGEKGVLMYSIIYGLHEMSGSDLPMIIDSPMGKMDSIHVNNLINKYYPIASDQVIILSHDREITKSIWSKMKNKLSHSFLLLSENVKKVKEGYFE